MRLAPVPTPTVLWREQPVLALAALRGAPLSRLGERSTASPAAWAAAGAVVRQLHDAPVPPWPSKKALDRNAELDAECHWLVANDVVPHDIVTRNRELAAPALVVRTDVFAHGDLHVAHVFADGDEITGVLDWSEAGAGDAWADLASLTLGHRKHLDDVLAGYGAGANTEAIHAWWSLRCLLAIRWLAEHGDDPSPEIAVLHASVRP